MAACAPTTRSLSPGKAEASEEQVKDYIERFGSMANMLVGATEPTVIESVENTVGEPLNDAARHPEHVH